MDARLALCLLTVILAVDARSYRDPQCRKNCPYGFAPGRTCECYWPNNGNGGYLPQPSPCDLKDCGLGYRCAERYGRAVCVSIYPTYPRAGGFNQYACKQPKETGLCKAYIPRFYFNKLSQSCERFIYGGCGGNSNNFESIQECRATCERELWSNVNSGHTGRTWF